MIVAPILSVAESMLNAALAQDPGSQARCQTLLGKVMQVSVTDWSIDCYVIVGENRLLLSDSYQGNVDVSLLGSGFSLLRLLRSGDARGSLQGESLTLSGDMHVAQGIQGVLSDLDIDWQGLIARYTGDAFAHELGEVGRSGLRFGRRFLRKMRVDLADGIHEELALAPARAAVDDFCDQVDQLRFDADRLWQHYAQAQLQD